MHRAAILAIALLPATANAAGAGFTLHEGSDVIVSVQAEEIIFELAGRIWKSSSTDPSATPLTAISGYARRPSISPDGSLIAYETIRDGFHQIIVMRADGGNPRQVSFGPYHHRTPAWSPVSNSRLVISSDRGGDYGLWELDLEVLSLRQLTFLEGDELEPAWNADGTRLAFVSPTESGSAIYSLETDATTARLLTENSRMRAPSWRPGGGIVTYVREDENGSQLRMLILSDPAITKHVTRTESVHPGPVRWLDRENFIYAADGRIRRRQFGLPSATDVPFEARVDVAKTDYAQRKVDFADIDNRPVTGITGLARTPQGTLIVAALGDLWEFAADAGGDHRVLRQLTNDAFIDTHPAVSPDGTRLAFVSDRDGSLQVWILNLNDMRQRRLTSEPGMAIRPAWDPDSTAVAYLAGGHSAETSLTLKRIEIAGRRTRVLMQDIAHPGTPTWDESSESFSAESRPDRQESVTASASNPLESVPLTRRSFHPDGTLIVRAGRIFDGIGPGYVTEQEIVIQGNRIAEIRPWTDADSRERVIDATDKTVVPGFIDLSVRQTYASSEPLGRTWLAYGVTTIRESVFDYSEASERRESWNSGRRIGPRMLVSLRLCNRDFQSGQADALPSPTGGADIASIELCASLRGELLEDAINAAHESHLPVTTQTPFPGILLGADEFQLIPGAGPDGRSITGYDIATLAGTSGKAVLSRLSIHGMPGMFTGKSLAGQERYRRLFNSADRSWYAETWNRASPADPLAARPTARYAGQVLFRAIATGARVAVGSGAPAAPPGLGLHAELRLLTDIGLQPFQVLKMASLDAARLIGAGEQIGSIHVGKLADLAIIDGDPLANIADSSEVVITIANGRAYALDELLSRGRRANSVGKLYN